MENISPVMEAPPPAETVDEQLVAEAQAFEERLQRIREMATTELGKHALSQAGMPEVFLSQDRMGNPPMTFVEHGIARIALGGL